MQRRWHMQRRWQLAGLRATLQLAGLRAVLQRASPTHQGQQPTREASSTRLPSSAAVTQLAAPCPLAEALPCTATAVHVAALAQHRPRGSAGRGSSAGGSVGIGRGGSLGSPGLDGSAQQGPGARPQGLSSGLAQSSSPCSLAELSSSTQLSTSSVMAQLALVHHRMEAHPLLTLLPSHAFGGEQKLPPPLNDYPSFGSEHRLSPPPHHPSTIISASLAAAAAAADPWCRHSHMSTVAGGSNVAGMGSTARHGSAASGVTTAGGGRAASGDAASGAAAGMPTSPPAAAAAAGVATPPSSSPSSSSSAAAAAGVPAASPPWLTAAAADGQQQTQGQEGGGGGGTDGGGVGGGGRGGVGGGGVVGDQVQLQELEALLAGPLIGLPQRKAKMYAQRGLYKVAACSAWSLQNGARRLRHELGFNKRQVQHMVAFDMKCLARSAAAIRRFFDWAAQDVGLSLQTARAMAASSPALTSLTTDTLRVKAHVLLEAGATWEQLAGRPGVLAAVLRRSPEYLRLQVEFLKEVGLELEMALRVSSYWKFGLASHVGPRIAFAHARGIDLSDEVALSRCLFTSTPGFVDQYCDGDAATFEAFRAEWGSGQGSEWVQACGQLQALKGGKGGKGGSGGGVGESGGGEVVVGSGQGGGGAEGGGGGSGSGGDSEVGVADMGGVEVGGSEAGGEETQEMGERRDEAGGR